MNGISICPFYGSIKFIPIKETVRGFKKKAESLGGQFNLQPFVCFGM